MTIGDGTGSRGVFRPIRLLVAAVVLVALCWWLLGRLTVDGRRIAVERWGDEPVVTATTARPLRILTWNIAHGRGDVGAGLFQNWMGGTAEVRAARLAEIARVLRDSDADIVVLNEVDFDSHWSGGLNQAEVLARRAGYPIWVEQRNYDVRLPFWTLSFGNAVLARFPVKDADVVRLPPHSIFEALLVGAKTASRVAVETPLGTLGVVPVHLETRSAGTRLAALSALDSLRAAESAPLVLAGDFNTSPVGWPGADDVTIVGELLARGWQSARAHEAPDESAWTFTASDPARAIDWILAEPPLRVLEARVLQGSFELSDHAAVLAVVGVDRGGGG